MIFPLNQLIYAYTKGGGDIYYFSVKLSSVQIYWSSSRSVTYDLWQRHSRNKDAVNHWWFRSIHVSFFLSAPFVFHIFFRVQDIVELIFNIVFMRRAFNTSYFDISDLSYLWDEIVFEMCLFVRIDLLQSTLFVGLLRLMSWLFKIIVFVCFLNWVLSSEQ